jgi:hypothetical protein
MDRRLAQLAKRTGHIYTRYADDMSFSGASARMLGRIRPFLVHIIHDSGFRVNPRKTRLSGPSRPLKITGLILSQGNPGIGRKRLRQIRAKIHRLHTREQTGDLLSVQGLLDFVWDVDRTRYRLLATYITKLLRDNSQSVLAKIRMRA